MARYYKIQLGSTPIYFTDDGTETGKPCKIEVDGLPGLLVRDLGNVTVSANGTPFRESPAESTGGGRAFSLRIKWLKDTVYEDIIEFLDGAAEDGGDFQVVGEGVPGDFDVQAFVNDNPTYVAHGGFSDDMVKDVVINLITVSFNES